MVDFFFSVNEMFFAVVLLFSLFYATSLDNGSPAEIAGMFHVMIAKFQDFQSAWLAFTIYFIIRALVLYFTMDSLSFEYFLFIKGLLVLYTQEE